MRRATYVLMAVNALLWGGLSVMGALMLRSIEPNRAQIIWYGVYPTAALAMALLFPIWPLRAREESLAVGALLGTLGLMPVYLFFYRGG
jgi:hypothetical protein